MTTEKILGYEVSSDEMTLTSFIANARQRYQELEDAIVPVDAKIEALQKNWYPLPRPFWKLILEKDIPAIRQAVHTCLYLFSKECSTVEAPTPIIISATSIRYTTDLHSISDQIEEVGILLTAHLCSVLSQSEEQEIRECRRFLHALQQLSKAVHKAVDRGRVKLDEAADEQARLLAPPTQKAKQPQIAAKPKGRKPRNATRPVLRIIKDRGEGGAI